MKNKQLKELLAQYPDDAEVIVNCNNYHMGNGYAYPLTGVNMVNRKYTTDIDFEKVIYSSEFIELTGQAS